MNDFELLLNDRLEKIKAIISLYGEDHFYVSFSGGKDSTVLSELIDMAVPGNKIPRVYSDTGIELNMIRNFVYGKSERDSRVVIIKPNVKIRTMLEKEGYPFKSKRHSRWVGTYQKRGMDRTIHNYLHDEYRDLDLFQPCPEKLKYQFTPDFNIKISDKCCVRMKEEPLDKWAKENKRDITITGIMKEEGGRRGTSVCLAFVGNNLKKFQPMLPITKKWEDWFIEKYNIEICEIYKPPYNFVRTGCKGCPFALNLSEELKTLKKFFPEERKQCEMIWKPIYDEYRRIKYRLKGDENENLS